MSTRPIWLLALAVGAVTSASCGSAPLTAPPGASIFVQVNPPFVIANGGTAVVTALLTEPAGTFVPDGTEVYFFTNLGRIDSMVKTRNGVANANFVSDSRSGTATVTVWSGGPAPAGGGSSTSSSTSSTVPVSTGGTGTATVQITIGSALPANVIVTADPQVLAVFRQSTIRANVFDSNGNPVQNVPVVFALTATSGGGGTATPAPVLLQEILDSGGVPQFTDSNGQAFDTLRTRAPNGLTQKTVTVTATTPNGKSGSVGVAVNYDALGP